MTQTINIDVTFDSPGEATLAFCLLHHAAEVVARGCREQLERGMGDAAKASALLEQAMTQADMRASVAALAGQLMQSTLASLASTLKVDETPEVRDACSALAARLDQVDLVERSPVEVVRDGLARVFRESNIVIGMEGWTPSMLETAAGWILEVENGAPQHVHELLTRVSAARSTTQDGFAWVAPRGFLGSTAGGETDDADRDPQPGNTGAFTIDTSVKARAELAFKELIEGMAHYAGGAADYVTSVDTEALVKEIGELEQSARGTTPSASIPARAAGEPSCTYCSEDGKYGMHLEKGGHIRAEAFDHDSLGLRFAVPGEGVTWLQMSHSEAVAFGSSLHEQTALARPVGQTEELGEVLMTLQLVKVSDEGYRVFDVSNGGRFLVGSSYADGHPIDAWRDVVDSFDQEHQAAAMRERLAPAVAWLDKALAFVDQHDGWVLHPGQDLHGYIAQARRLLAP